MTGKSFLLKRVANLINHASIRFLILVSYWSSGTRQWPIRKENIFIWGTTCQSKFLIASWILPDLNIMFFSRTFLPCREKTHAYHESQQTNTNDAEPSTKPNQPIPKKSDLNTNQIHHGSPKEPRPAAYQTYPRSKSIFPQTNQRNLPRPSHINYPDIVSSATLKATPSQSSPFQTINKSCDSLVSQARLEEDTSGDSRPEVDESVGRWLQELPTLCEPECNNMLQSKVIN